MASRSISTRANRAPAGFTLVELLIVLALISCLFAFGAAVSLDAYRASLARSERDVIAGLLARARSDAMANTYQTNWGVCYIAPNYVIFRGTACIAGAATNEQTAANPNVAITGLSPSSPVVFSQLSGTTTPATVTVTEQGRTSTITINYEGAIQ